VRLEPVGRLWRVDLTLAERHVTRDVALVADAAAWVESWMMPALETPLRTSAASSPPAAEAPEAAPAAAEPAASQPGASTPQAAPEAPPTRQEPAGPSVVAAAAPAAGTWPSGHVALSGALELGDDKSVWGGGALSGRLFLTETFWAEAALGAAFDPVFDDDSAVGDDVRRRLMRASVRAGMALPLGRSLAVDAGLGVGLVTAVAVRDDAEQSSSDDDGAILVEALSGVTLGLGRWLLRGGLALRGAIAVDAPDDDSDTSATAPMPEAHPTAFGALELGVGYRFGGAP
jgi:hypothetical protein